MTTLSIMTISIAMLRTMILDIITLTTVATQNIDNWPNDTEQSDIQNVTLCTMALRIVTISLKALSIMTLRTRHFA
jgi:hypothetical protein